MDSFIKQGGGGVNFTKWLLIAVTVLVILIISVSLYGYLQSDAEVPVAEPMTNKEISDGEFSKIMAGY